MGTPVTSTTQPYSGHVFSYCCELQFAMVGREFRTYQCLPHSLLSVQSSSAVHRLWHLSLFRAFYLNEVECRLTASRSEAAFTLLLSFVAVLQLVQERLSSMTSSRRIAMHHFNGQPFSEPPLDGNISQRALCCFSS